MTDYLALPLGEQAPEIVAAVIEASHRKITKYDRQSNEFRPVKAVDSPIYCPGNTGFIPQTLSAGGDPLAILMLGDSSTFPGCIRFGRPIGLMELTDHGIRFERILACAIGNPHFGGLRNYTDVKANLLREIEHFVSMYRSSKGRSARVVGWKDRRAAHESIRTGHARFVSHAAKKP